MWYKMLEKFEDDEWWVDMSNIFIYKIFKEWEHQKVACFN